MILENQTIDDLNQSGQMVAAPADPPQASFTGMTSVAGDTRNAVHDIDGALEKLALEMHVIVATNLGVDATPRIKTIRVSEAA